MSSIRFVMLGGFLGAGKTTTLARLAQHYTQQGLRVGIVTNDQADNLVDTGSLRSQGFPVEEVAGACFCCKFSDLVSKVGALEAEARPNLILAEPVGSCTDLVATVVQPLRDLYRDRFQVAPYAVLFKPSHGLKILRGESGGGFSPKAAYIFTKQLEEADAIVINRADELSPADRGELEQRLREHYPGTPVLVVSAKTGAGFEALTTLLDQDGAFGRKILDIDYDIYAAGEAELGWLNCTIQVRSERPFALDELLRDVIARLHARLVERGGEAAHLKVIGLSDGMFGVANVVSNATGPELSVPSHATTDHAELVVNARAALDPVELESELASSVSAASAAIAAEATIATSQSLRPGRPVPTHRYTAPV